jgi:beta-carotene 3-hydroxylase
MAGFYEANSMLKVIGVTVGSFLFMEAASWFIHKYIMHGPLWNIHKTHHVKGKQFLELNDLFSASFGAVAVLSLLYGLHTGNAYYTGIGAGISLYGIVYFILHDVLIHRRLAVKSKINNPYLRGLANAHRDHHKTPNRDGAVAFGLLWVPLRYFRTRKS